MRIAREGSVYIVAPVVLTFISLALGLWFPGYGLWVAAILFGVLAAFMVYFFRDPHRSPPGDPNVVVAPADGRVTRVSRIDEGEHAATIVSIFLSPLDVHINRSPIAGTVKNVAYARGKFLMATNESASLVNEQNALTIEGETITIVCKQIAGILARRIVCWKQAGDKVALGERFGLIKFSSRTDLLLPASVQVSAKEGQRVKGGTTIIGRIR